MYRLTNATHYCPITRHSLFQTVSYKNSRISTARWMNRKKERRVGIFQIETFNVIVFVPLCTILEMMVSTNNHPANFVRIETSEKQKKKDCDIRGCECDMIRRNKLRVLPLKIENDPIVSTQQAKYSKLSNYYGRVVPLTLLHYAPKLRLDSREWSELAGLNVEWLQGMYIDSISIKSMNREANICTN